MPARGICPGRNANLLSQTRSILPPSGDPEREISPFLQNPSLGAGALGNPGEPPCTWQVCLIGLCSVEALSWQPMAALLLAV